MLDQLMNLARQQLAPALKEKEHLNDQQVNQTFDVAKGSFFDSLKGQALSGNISQLTNLFNGKESNSSFLSGSVMKHIVPALASKLGISPEKANSIASMVVPVLISKFSSKETGAANDSNGLMKMLGIEPGNMLGDLGSKLGGLFG